MEDARKPFKPFKTLGQEQEAREHVTQSRAREAAASAHSDLLILAAWCRQEGYGPRADLALQIAGRIEEMWGVVRDHQGGAQ